MKPFKILSRKTLIESPFCPIEKQIVELPNGNTAEWFVNLNEGAVIIIPILKNGEILLQKNYKHGSGQVVTEFSAGMIDKGEEPREAAKRELLEETGFTAPVFHPLGKIYSNPTGSRMQYHYFLAENAEKTHEPELEDAEQIETFTVKNLEALKMLLLDPESKSTAATLGGIMFLENFLTKRP